MLVSRMNFRKQSSSYLIILGIVVLLYVIAYGIGVQLTDTRTFEEINLLCQEEALVEVLLYDQSIYDNCMKRYGYD